MKICGHGTILALMDNRKTRTVSLIQPTVLVFLVIRSKYCFMEPLPTGGSFLLQSVFAGGGSAARHGSRVLIPAAAGETASCEAAHIGI